MWKPISALAATLAATVLAAVPALASDRSDLTDTESRWLTGARPVIAFARAAGLPLDIIVQPQPTAGAAPLALAYIDGRCKLVLSMRGNPEAEQTLARIEPELLDATLELMAAHEIGHCRRYVDGAWYRVPAGFGTAAVVAHGSGRHLSDADGAAARREEGYGDLVGLAWTQRRHPGRYARLHAWLVDQREQDSVPGSPHDTLAWVRLAGDGATLAHESVFAASTRLWLAVLSAEASQAEGSRVQARAGERD